MPKTAHMAFIGRKHLLERARASVAAGQHIALVGAEGIGKTTLGRRMDPAALYVEHIAPVKEMLSTLLMEAYRKGWYSPVDGESDQEPDAAQVEKTVRRLDVKTATTAAHVALREAAQIQPVVLILDNFERASPSVINALQRLKDCATLVVCTPFIKEGHRAFLFSFEKIEVTRLTPAESGELIDRLLSEYSEQIDARELPALKRHILEQAQGVPAVCHELVTRMRRKGEMSLREVRKETDVHAHRTIDMTPAVLVFACLLLALRFVIKGMGDADLTALVGGSGALFMIVRIFMFRMSGGRR